MPRYPESQQRSCIRNLLLAKINSKEFLHGIAVINGILNPFIGQIKPCLHQIHAKHTLYSFWRAATLSLGIKGRYHSYPSFPWNDLIHLLQKIFTFRHSFPMTVLALRHDKHLLTPVNSYMSIVSYDRTFEKSGNKSVFP